jgi:DNA-binding transcriptional LysR family regulator
VEPLGPRLRGLRFRELARFPICVGVAPGHPLAKRRTVPLGRIATEPLIAYSAADYPEYHRSLEKLFASIQQTPKIAEEHDSVTSLIAAVEAGRGVAIVPSSITCMAGPRLKVLALTPAPPPVVVGAVCRSGAISPGADHFVAAALSLED